MNIFSIKTGRTFRRSVFHGQKPAIHGQNGTETVFTICYEHSKQNLHSSYLYVTVQSASASLLHLYTDLNGGKFMRHFYFRLIFGIVWLAAAVVSAMRSNISLATLYAVLGIGFLWSACSTWKKERDKDDDR